MSEFRLGPFQFISLSRAVSRPVHRVERELRPGIDGVTFWRTGRRAEPFDLVSVVDTPDVGGALALLAAYEDTVGSDPVEAVWADLALPELLVLVHNVVPLDEGLHATLLGLGGVNGVATFGLLRCQWTVEPIDPTLF